MTYPEQYILCKFIVSKSKVPPVKLKNEELLSLHFYIAVKIRNGKIIFNLLDKNFHTDSKFYNHFNRSTFKVIYSEKSNMARPNKDII